MTDIDDKVREVLERRADDVPAHREVPPSLGRRARRRISLNALALGTVVAVLAAGAFVGFRAFTGPAGERLGQQPTPSSSVRTQSSVSGTHACTSGQLRANGTLLGAMGSREGVIDLANFSDRTCTLKGRPHITLLKSNGHPITSGVTFLPSPAGWAADASPKPAGWPVVTIRPGDAASVRIRWSNWCPQDRAAPLWRVGIPRGGAVNVTNGLEGMAPPCNGPGQPSTVEVGPFEPARQP